MSHSKLKATNGEVTENFGLPDFSSLDSESLTLVRSELQALNEDMMVKPSQLNEFDMNPFGTFFDAKFSGRFCRNT